MAKTLSAFLAQNAKKVDNRKIALSPRFSDENGNAIEWEISCITAAENQKLRKDCLRNVPISGKRGQYTQELDTATYQAKLAARCTIFPDFNDVQLQESYGVMSAEQLAGVMLTPAEFDDLIIAITELCGFTSESDLADEAKN